MKADKTINKMVDYIMGQDSSLELRVLQGHHVLRKDGEFLFLLPRRYSNQEYDSAKNLIGRLDHADPLIVKPVFLKDGTTYFRSSLSEKNDLKPIVSKKHRSLKNYTPAQLRRIISLTPLEKRFVPSVHYYQPQSERLEEGLITYHFGNVTYDYSHIPSERRSCSVNNDSGRLFIWSYYLVHQGKFISISSFKTETRAPYRPG